MADLTIESLRKTYEDLLANMPDLLELWAAPQVNWPSILAEKLKPKEPESIQGLFGVEIKTNPNLPENFICMANKKTGEHTYFNIKTGEGFALNTRDFLFVEGPRGEHTLLNVKTGDTVAWIDVKLATGSGRQA